MLNSPEGSGQKNSGSILVADDSAEIRGLVQCILESEGYEIRTAQDANEALSLFQQQPPDLLIVNQVMPGRLGLDLVRELNRLGFQVVPKIMLTGTSQKILSKQAEDLGQLIQGFIQKPFDINDLTQTITQVLFPNQVPKP